MATHFLHLVLSFEGVAELNLKHEEELKFLSGALLPDAAEFQDKKRTHFSGNRWSMRFGRNNMLTTLNQVPFWVKAGWELHLELDRLWQNRCIRASLYRLPALVAKYGDEYSSKYYEELSGFDIIVRQGIPTQQLAALEDVVDKLWSIELPEEIAIGEMQWKEFLASLKLDFSKEKVYSGPPIVGWKRAERFLKESRQLISGKVRQWNANNR